MEKSWMSRRICIFVILCVSIATYGATFPGDLKILNDFRKGLENSELLEWPDNGNDPCGPPWPHVYCNGDRITQIKNFNQLSKLNNLGFQKNNFNGKLPTFSGLLELEFAYLDNNDFDTILFDFFDGLISLRVMALDHIPLNASTGWSLPNELAKSVQLQNPSLIECNLAGPLPEFLGTLPSLTVLQLLFNILASVIPTVFAEFLVQTLWLNNQDGRLIGPVDVIASMSSLTQVWLRGNQFTRTILANIDDLSSLRELNLNGNQLVGLIPQSLADIKLDKLDLGNNRLMGAIPKFKFGNVSYNSNPFCQIDPGLQCAPEVTALLDFLSALNYPFSLASKCSDNNPCEGSRKLIANLSPSLAKLDSLIDVRLPGNNISGKVPTNFTKLKSLRLLDNRASFSKISPPPLNKSQPPSNSPSDTPSYGGGKTPLSHSPPSPITHSSPNPSVIIVAGIAVVSIAALLMICRSIYCCNKKEKKNISEASSSVVIHPRDPSDPENMYKVSVSSNTTGSLSTKTWTTVSNFSSGTENSHTIEAGNLVISFQVLRKMTKGFAPENELHCGGFGTVYKGELDDGTKIAVKRMEGGVISKKALDEFQSEIDVLSKVRHQHLVSFLGYSVEGNERLLAYEYMSQGALSRHLFHWKSFNLKPLSWTRRLIILLDVARVMEYLHNLARQTFIHRDLKSSNILVMGKITTKAYVFSFGVVLMELLTGLMALDENWPEETELAGHCTAREPSHRPKMGHAVNSLLIENWKPVEDESNCFSGIDYNQPLPQMLKVWKESKSQGVNYNSLEDSKGSIPARPNRFAESFTSADGR
ncbi:receptor protein kinase TMK1 [Pyrus ussuriensis x Pyrus communis]|uniref:Receptor protein kinase TMK1 n=1 Tax=Pyrus ussuriensis x Pyrus communis TaxID=2448454 RepID=A0A5N5GGA0_9ROSA|nr:receptor protein kinase TMK1 [Pyrus ussuriensis x Pyrus communis]